MTDMTPTLPPLPKLPVFSTETGLGRAVYGYAEAEPGPVARMAWEYWVQEAHKAMQSYATEYGEQCTRAAVADDCETLAAEIERLQKALAFWMPDVPPTDHPLHERVANDVYLLVGYDGPNNEPSAFDLGHVAMATHPPTQQDSRIAFERAIEALDELEAAARGDEPFPHFAGPLIRQTLAAHVQEPCEVPPSGWYCTREKGHGGPCAAHPAPQAATPPAVEARVPEVAVLAGWLREWEGDDSDIGQWVFAATEDEKDDSPNWREVYWLSAAPAPTEPQGVPEPAEAMASYTLNIVADSGYEASTEGRCNAAQYGAAIAALHGAAHPQQSGAAQPEQERKPLTDAEWRDVFRAASEAYFSPGCRNLSEQVQACAHAAMRETERRHGITKESP